MKYVLRGLLLLHPFVPYLFKGTRMDTVTALAGILFVFIVFLLFLINCKEHHKTAFPYLWMLTFIHTLFLNRQGSASNMHISIMFFIHISVFFMFYYAVVHSELNWEYIVKPLGYSCILVSIYSILERLGITQFEYTWFQQPSLLGNSTNTAMYITVITPFLLLHKRSLIWVFIPILAVFMLDSASAVLGMVAIILGFIFLKRCYLIGGITVLGIVPISIWKWGYFKGLFYTNNKLVLWSQAMSDYKQFWLIGRGLGNFQGRYIIDNVPWFFMHNHYLWVLYTLGGIGFICFILWIYPVLVTKGKPLLPLLSVISVGVMALCSVPMRVYPIVLLTAFNMGILTKGGMNEKSMVSNTMSFTDKRQCGSG